mmetsp:Transcript_4826/g.17836  ORF Transcript_4826/g.17836 Transcript_4826/m.17836 type:complete len:319 (+) Transcript_4826:2039-2995(+)
MGSETAEERGRLRFFIFLCRGHQHGASAIGPSGAGLRAVAKLHRPGAPHPPRRLGANRGYQARRDEDSLLHARARDALRRTRAASAMLVVKTGASNRRRGQRRVQQARFTPPFFYMYADGPSVYVERRFVEAGPLLVHVGGSQPDTWKGGSQPDTSKGGSQPGASTLFANVHVASTDMLLAHDRRAGTEAGRKSGYRCRSSDRQERLPLPDEESRNDQPLRGAAKWIKAGRCGTRPLLRGSASPSRPVSREGGPFGGLWRLVTLDSVIYCRALSGPRDARSRSLEEVRLELGLVDARRRVVRQNLRRGAEVVVRRVRV